MSAPYKVLIDRDGDDIAEYDVTDLVDGAIGVSWSRGKEQIKQFAPGAAGQATFVLLNLSREFSIDAANPLVSGRKVRIETSGTAGADFQFQDLTDFEFQDGTQIALQGAPGRVIWTGVIDDIVQDPENKRVGILCLGTLSRLRGKSISTPLYQNILTSDFLEHVLDEAGWPSGERSIQTGLTTIAWAWADDNQDAFDQVMSIVATEGPGASLYEDPNGFLVFENRDSRTTQIRSTVPQASFIDTEIAGRLSYNSNRKDAIQAATLTVQERQRAGQTVVWQYGSDLVLTPGQVKRIPVRSGGDPFMGAVLPSAAPNDTVQTLTGSAPFTAGQFKPRFREETAAVAIDWDSTAAELQTSLESISTIGPGNVVCNGGPMNTMPISAALVGIFAGQAITDLIEIVESTLNPVSAPATIEVTETHRGDGILSEIQALRPSSPLAGGAFVVEMPIEHPFSTSSQPYNVTNATLQAAVRGSGSWGSVTVSGGPLSSGIPFQINLIYSTDLSPITIGGAGVTASVPTATINVSITTQGGIPDYVKTAGDVSFSLDRTSGPYVTLVATAGVLGATVTGLQLRGNLVSVVRTHQVSYPEDTTAIPVGKIFKPSNVRAEISKEFAAEYTQMLVDHYSVARPTVPLEVHTSIYDDNDALHQREISDMISLVEAQTGISANFHIEQSKQSLSQTSSGLLLITEFGCEQVLASFGSVGAPPPAFWH